MQRCRREFEQSRQAERSRKCRGCVPGSTSQRSLSTCIQAPFSTTNDKWNCRSQPLYHPAAKTLAYHTCTTQNPTWHASASPSWFLAAAAAHPPGPGTPALSVQHACEAPPPVSRQEHVMTSDRETFLALGARVLCLAEQHASMRSASNTPAVRHGRHIHSGGAAAQPTAPSPGQSAPVAPGPP